jgi:serine/threonine protein kinase
VGSDPYLAPEVFLQKQYDAEKVDIWSLAIIFCCMTLRRFPWKCPKSTDNSFKLFITQPSNEELATSLYPGGAKTTQSEPTSRHPSGHASHSESAHSLPPNTTAGASAKSSASADAQSVHSTTTTVTPTASSTAQIIKGPWRLLRLLPRETRHIVGAMLETDPNQRASLKQVMSDPWIEKMECCLQEEGGNVIHVDGHTHTLAAPDDAVSQ